MEESNIYIIPLPIFPSINCQTATATIKAVKTNFIFLLNISIFVGSQRYKKQFEIF